MRRSELIAALASATTDDEDPLVFMDIRHHAYGVPNTIQAGSVASDGADGIYLRGQERRL